MGAIRVCTSMLKRRLAMKLVVLLVCSTLFMYYMSTGTESESLHRDLKARHNELRHVLNTNEDNMDSLRAPTTDVPQHLGGDAKDDENGPPPGPAEYVRSNTIQQPDRHQKMNPLNEANGQERDVQSPRHRNRDFQDDNWMREDGNADWQQKSSTRSSSTVKSTSHSTSDRSKSTSRSTRGSNVNAPAVPEHKVNYTPENNTLSSVQNNKIPKLESGVKTAAKTVEKTIDKPVEKAVDKIIEQEEKMRKLKNLEKPKIAKKPRVKEKQWETYDYENPYNLLQIHVDRAPDHQDGMGQPWPMPQVYNTDWNTYVVDVDNFVIEQPVRNCGRVSRAIRRYATHINSKLDLFLPDGAKLLDVNRHTGTVIRRLKVTMSRPCKDGDLPHEHMSEQYKLMIDENGGILSAQEPWGVIRGLETFSQLIYYSNGYAKVNTTHIKDYPRFRFRGLMLDTARHYIPIKHLKRTMDAMSYNKLNVFHWHMVDDQSFPYVSKVFPKLSQEGAYSQSLIYTHSDIKQLIEYAADRAIRIIPEFDSPGHTRSWGLGYPKLLTNCSADYHPFGAVNPISSYTYEFMNKFWQEIAELFPDSTVHVGGDEINYKCWLRLKTIREFMVKNNMTTDNYDFMVLDGDKLQGYYLKHLLEVMPKDRKKIAWEEAFAAAQHWNVSTDELIINVWKGGDYDWQFTMENVVRHGYKAILSAPWYLNYISYGRDWTKYYEQDPHTFLMYSSGSDVSKENVLGGQVCMWAEFIDESNLEPTLWPRASSPAEKLWSSAMMNDWRKAEARFENHRCRMYRRGIRTQPNSGPGSCKGSMRIKPPYEAAQPSY